MTSSNRVLFRALALLSAVFASFAACAQDAAGRVIVAVGDVAIERGGQRIPAALNTEVRMGDLFQLGARSNAQVRLQDGSILALRPDTTFRINEFQFVAGDETRQRAFFELVKGGVRTVTGAVGRVKRDNYRVVTATSTIGIRGTHYNLVACVDSCRNADGSLAPNGTYGAVTDGRISATNQAGEQVFGADQYFHVASADSFARPLIAPPPFMRDRLEGRLQSRPGATQPAGAGQQAASGGGETATTVAQTGIGATTGDTGVSGSVSNPAPVVLPPTATLNAFLVNETQTAGGVPPTVQAGFDGTVFYRLAGALNIPVICASGGSCGSISVGDIILSVNFALQRAYARISVGGPDGGRVNFGTPFNSDGMPITVGNGQVSFSQNFLTSDYPTQQGSFRCNNCSPSDGPGFIGGVNLSGTIANGVATLNVAVTDRAGTESFTATLNQTSLPNSDVAAMVVPRQAGGADARSEAYWNASLNGARQVVGFGPGVGAIRADVGSANNVTLGGNAAAGNLVWGYWQGAGAQITDFNYVSYTTTTQTVPWISGTAVNSLPATLGTANYALVGGFVNAGTGTLNSGSLTADFVNRTVGLSLNATNVVAGNTFQMNGSSSFSPVNGRFSAGFATVTCTGPCAGGTPSGSFGGFFSGAQAEGAGVAFTAGFGAGNGVSGVAGFRR